MWKEFIKRLYWVAVGLAGGLLGAGVIYLTSRQPAGVPIQLNDIPSPAPIVVHIVGAVENPGVYTLTHKSRIIDAVGAAGGFLPGAEQSALNLAKYLQDGERINVPDTISITQNMVSLANKQFEIVITPAGGLININLATQAELESLPGIGEVKSNQIIAYRQQNGFFTSIDQIQKVSGIGPKTFENIQAFITVDQ